MSSRCSYEDAGCGGVLPLATDEWRPDPVGDRTGSACGTRRARPARVVRPRSCRPDRACWDECGEDRYDAVPGCGLVGLAGEVAASSRCSRPGRLAFRRPGAAKGIRVAGGRIT